MAAEKMYVAMTPRFFDGVYRFEGDQVSMDPKRAEAINKAHRRPPLVEMAGQAKTSPVPAGE